MPPLTNPHIEAVTASAADNIIEGNRGLLTKLADGEWIPSRPEEIVAALRLLAEEQRYILAQIAGTDANGQPKTHAARVAWL